MKEVDLTHGGFYGHFSSKEELIAMAALRALSQTIANWRKVTKDAPGDRMVALFTSYLSLHQHDHPGSGCLVATPGGDISRQPSAVKDGATEGERQCIDFLSGIAPGKTKTLRRKQAVASMVGAMTLARITVDIDLRQEILGYVAHVVPNSTRAIA